MTAKRLTYYLEQTNNIDERQYGFREGRTTTEAIDKIITKIRHNKDHKIHTLVITLDMSNAFNTAWTPQVVDILRQKNTPRNIAKLCTDFLKHRHIRTENIETDTHRGCPQGSSLGPALWNLIMEDWFRYLDETGGLDIDDMIQAFADDQIILLTGTSLNVLERKWRSIWAACTKWAENQKLTYNKDKTEIMFIPYKTTRQPRLKMDGHTVQIKDNIEYLGLTIDTGLLFLDHIKKVRKKTSDIASKLIAVTGRKWGRKPLILRHIYEHAIKPMVLYASEIWGHRYKDSRIIRQLRATERPYLLAITKAYRTTPTSALHVLAGVTPLQADAGARWETYIRRKPLLNTLHTYTTDKPHPTRRPLHLRLTDETQEEQTSQLHIYTDASKKDESSTIGIYIKNTIQKYYKIKVTTTCDINTLEMYAIYMGTTILLELAQNTPSTEVTIHTDSKNAIYTLQHMNTNTKITAKLTKNIQDLEQTGKTIMIQYTNRQRHGMQIADRLAKEAHEQPEQTTKLFTKNMYKQERHTLAMRHWQQLWDNETTGRKTYEWIKHTKHKYADLNWKTIQALTGHGHIQTYYERFNLRETDGNCTHCQTPETIQHVRNDCTDHDRLQARTLLTTRLRTLDIQYPPTDIDIHNETIAVWLNEWAQQTIHDDETN
ncbi:uncharacterized protein LOC130903290 [Diorhabda carinulata]|uniref:uncharacterized protein LOC130898876 n=1 Tax=Diorhabda carinulata TaxID=1163345 RepID=UPI0025A0C8A2|nr:uncharacterized protein LOC130898876 [Diorhabda carinulata]XP_057671381.1 uncharacterized protein LOC130903289 [Diorhabda carinulata]XP_057671382.1 uncharacterized protein LOC130903290 [Diorhabda carinulata]